MDTINEFGWIESSWAGKSDGIKSLHVPFVYPDGRKGTITLIKRPEEKELTVIMNEPFFLE